MFVVQRAVSHTRLRFEVIASVSISFTKVSPRVKLKAKDSKEKLKTYDKPVAIRKPQSTRRLEHTKDVVGSYRKAPKASQKGSKHGKPPSHKQRKQHSGKKADSNGEFSHISAYFDRQYTVVCAHIRISRKR
ncbi:hypothetical protein GCK32_012765 [Trichostrongylus colubriformis]|uniref:Uncharacterized protein n=1 Tax=Trichostrongylus colubriformis TaxID=6319 RepID=A0AAN8ISM5_TRICO